MRERVIFIGRIIENRVFAPALAGVRRYAQARGWDVETIDWNEARTGSPKALRSPPRPIGFIVEGSDLPPDLPHHLYDGAPVVFCNCSRAPRDASFAHLVIDEAAVAHTAFRELSASLPPACAVVGYCLGRRNWSDDRSAAFRAEAAKAGLSCHSFDFLDPRKADASGELNRLADWLSSLPRHSAVFAVNDETAAVVAEAARAARLNVPRDLSLLGADNDASICEASHPTLSSIQMDFESAGFLAASMLERKIKGRAEREIKGRAEHGIKGLAEQEIKGLAGREMKGAASAANENDSSFGGLAATLNSREARPSFRAARDSSFHQWSDGSGNASVGPLMAVRRESTRGSGRREPHILEAVEVIRRKACDGLTVEALASRFPGSRRLFEMRFREAMGHSVLDEILHVRLENVHTLLSRSDVPLAAIADSCGFNSDRALRKFFLSRERMSMTEWRRLHGMGSWDG